MKDYLDKLIKSKSKEFQEWAKNGRTILECGYCGKTTIINSLKDNTEEHFDHVSNCRKNNLRESRQCGQAPDMSLYTSDEDTPKPEFKSSCAEAVNKKYSEKLNEFSRRIDSILINHGICGKFKLMEDIKRAFLEVTSENDAPGNEKEQKKPLHPGKVAIDLLLVNGCTLVCFNDRPLCTNVLNIKKACEILGTSEDGLKEFLNGNHSVDYIMAGMLAKVIKGTDVRFWMDLQERYDNYKDSKNENAQ